MTIPLGMQLQTYPKAQLTILPVVISTPAPEPIDPQIAQVLASNTNKACSGPSGCIGVRDFL